VSRITPSVSELRRSPDHPVVQPVSTHPLAAVTRRFCGLPATQPIVATGHQPVLPHPGILAKYIMVNRLASMHAACMVNAVVDTGTGPLGQLDVPCGGGHTLNMLDEGTGLWATRGAARVRPLQMPVGCAASIERGIQEVSAVWLQGKGETAAHQAAAAQATVIRPWAGSFHNVWASQLLASPIDRFRQPRRKILTSTERISFQRHSSQQPCCGSRLSITLCMELVDAPMTKSWSSGYRDGSGGRRAP
jgi:hypothetical protein